MGQLTSKVRISFDVRCDTADRGIVIKSYDPLGPVGTLSEIYDITLADTWYTATYEFTWGANDNAVHINTNQNDLKNKYAHALHLKTPFTHTSNPAVPKYKNFPARNTPLIPSNRIENTMPNRGPRRTVRIQDRSNSQ